MSSSFLFTLFKKDCVSSQPNQHVVKFSDDTAILSLLTIDSGISRHCAKLDTFVDWCNEHHLSINVKKTKQKQRMVFDSRSTGHLSPISINSENIKQVYSYKYPGVYIDNIFIWQTHVSNICSRIHQCFHFLRRLRIFGVRNILSDR